MLTSHPAISACVAGRPRFGVSLVAVAAAPAQPPRTTTQIATANASRVDIVDLAGGLHTPGLDRVIVVEDIRAVPGDELVARRLDAAGIVGRAALEHRGRPVPFPRDPEARQRVSQHRRRQGGLAPCLSAVRGDLDLTDLSVAGPRDSRHLVES